ncbi:MAG: hypothetical protein LUC24_02405 [Bacteroidales bacterium]|nr:hypothetical protein [Bacteroidales bacterium]
MKKGLETLFSKYIIDGAVMESTPADMLRECIYDEDWGRIFPSASESRPAEMPSDTFTEGQAGLGTIIDETPDRDPVPFKYDISQLYTYLDAVRSLLAAREDGHHRVTLGHPISSTRLLISESILKSIWRREELSLEDLTLSLSILWDSEPVGSMAAFHSAIEAATGYIYELGLHISDLSYNQQSGVNEMNFRVMAPEDSSEFIPQTLVERPDSLLIYVPFDTCSHKLGGSMLGKVLGKGDESGTEIADPDYFIDSFEVVHDLVQDGVALSGVTVARGGLIAAVDRLLGEDWRIDLDINGIQRAYLEGDRIRVLFSEIPGALFQIPERESDYVDSQFLLQDIAYYTLGQPVKRTADTNTAEPAATDAEKADNRLKITIYEDNKTALSRILSALINGQPEDPDISNFSEGDEIRNTDD